MNEIRELTYNAFGASGSTNGDGSEVGVEEVVHAGAVQLVSNSVSVQEKSQATSLRMQRNSVPVSITDFSTVHSHVDRCAGTDSRHVSQVASTNLQ
jgi:hypothetical protein